MSVDLKNSGTSSQDALPRTENEAVDRGLSPVCTLNDNAKSFDHGTITESCPQSKNTPAVMAVLIDASEDDFLDLEDLDDFCEEGVSVLAKPNAGKPCACNRSEVTCEPAQTVQKRGNNTTEPRHDTFSICNQAACICPKIPKMSSEYFGSSEEPPNHVSTSILVESTGNSETSTTQMPASSSNHDVMSYCSVQNLLKEPVLNDAYFSKHCAHRNNYPQSINAGELMPRISRSNEDLEQEKNRNLKRAPVIPRDCDTASTSSTQNDMLTKTGESYNSTALCSFRFYRENRTELVVQRIASASDGYSVKGFSSVVSLGSTVSEPQPLHEERTTFPMCDDGIQSSTMPSSEDSACCSQASSSVANDRVSSALEIQPRCDERLTSFECKLQPCSFQVMSCYRQEAATLREEQQLSSLSSIQSSPNENRTTSLSEDMHAQRNVHDILETTGGITEEAGASHQQHQQSKSKTLTSDESGYRLHERNDSFAATSSDMPQAHVPHRHLLNANLSQMQSQQSAIHSNIEHDESQTSRGEYVSNATMSTQTESNQHEEDGPTRRDQGCNTCVNRFGGEEKHLSLEESRRLDDTETSQSNCQDSSAESSVCSGLLSFLQLLKTSCELLQNSCALRENNCHTRSPSSTPKYRLNDSRSSKNLRQKRRSMTPRFQRGSHGSYEEGHPLRQFWQKMSKGQEISSATIALESPDEASTHQGDEEDGAADRGTDREPLPGKTASSLELEQNLRLANAVALHNMTSGCQYMPWTGNLPARPAVPALETSSSSRDEHRQGEDSDSGSGYCSTGPSLQPGIVSGVSASSPSSTQRGFQHDDSTQAINKNNGISRELQPAEEAPTSVVLQHRSLKRKARTRATSHWVYTSRAHQSSQTRRAVTECTRYRDKNRGARSRTQSRSRSRSPLRSKVKANSRNSRSSSSSYQNSVCRRSACARRAMDRASSEDSFLSNRHVAGGSEANSKHSVSSTMSHLKIADSELKEFCTTNLLAQGRRIKAESKGTGEGHSVLQRLRNEVSAWMQNNSNKRAKANTLASQQCGDIQDIRCGERHNAVRLASDAEDRNVQKVIIKENTKPLTVFDIIARKAEEQSLIDKQNINNTESVRSALASHGFAQQGHVTENCSNNTAIVSRSSSKESSTAGNNQNSRNRAKTSQIQNSAAPNPDVGRRVTIAADQASLKNPTASTNTTLPIFSFHNTAVQTLASSPTPLFPQQVSSNSPGGDRDTVKTSTTPKERKANTNSQSKREDVSESRGKTRAKSRIRKRKSFVGAFSGVGSNSQAATNESQTELHLNTDMPVLSARSFKGGAEFNDRPSDNTRSKTRQRKRRKQPPNTAEDGLQETRQRKPRKQPPNTAEDGLQETRQRKPRKQPPNTAEHGSQERGLGDVEEATEAEEEVETEVEAEALNFRSVVDSLEARTITRKETKEHKVSTSKERLYLRARRLLRQICYIKTKEEMLFRAALRLQYLRLQLQEEHSMLFVKAKSSHYRDEDTLSIASTYSSSR